MGLKWIGYQKGVEGLHGIPARDLGDEEVALYGGEAALVATGLYVPLSLEDVERYMAQLRADTLKGHLEFNRLMYTPGVHLTAEQEAEIQRLYDQGDQDGAARMIWDNLDAWKKEHFPEKMARPHESVTPRPQAVKPKPAEPTADAANDTKEH
jgi:hypothetical protein